MISLTTWRSHSLRDQIGYHTPRTLKLTLSNRKEATCKRNEVKRKMLIQDSLYIYPSAVSPDLTELSQDNSKSSITRITQIGRIVDSSEVRIT
ncbi:hypothetical protein AVEN_146385-1 [Araneus ventricosus]|uniref:Uncharacterized protein n=1 Tax=Araneus ventricosus TaxID=182803 RepID=A0A4Y2N0F9_ARAVE|nr:hypothetical protein AVEN_146385-1 [Araneus ventricosus]